MQSTKQEQVNYVLECFKCMEASPKDIAKETIRLKADEAYLHDWLNTTNFVPGKKPWVWNLLRRFGI
jgi:hypothetical protein